MSCRIMSQAVINNTSFLIILMTVSAIMTQETSSMQQSTNETTIEPRSVSHFSDSSVPDIDVKTTCLISCSSRDPCGSFQICQNDQDEEIKWHWQGSGHCACYGSQEILRDCREDSKSLTCEKKRSPQNGSCQEDADCEGDLMCFYPHTIYPVSYGSCEPSRVPPAGRCITDEQCIGHTQCINFKCRCEAGYSFNGHGCELLVTRMDNTNALQIYRITMIFASCCLALVLIMFLACIIRKTYCPSGPATRHTHSRRSSSSMQIAASEASIGSGIPFNIRPPYEKPPSYEESQRNMIHLMGSPPPEYVYPQELQPVVIDVPSVEPPVANSFDRAEEQADDSSVNPTNGPETRVEMHSGLSNRAFQPD